MPDTTPPGLARQSNPIRLAALARADARRAARLAGPDPHRARTNGAPSPNGSRPWSYAATPLARANERARAGRGARAGTWSPASRARAERVPRVANPAQGLLASGFLIGLGIVGLLVLRSDLVFAASTALVAGLIALGLFLPLAALQELPLNAAGLTGLGAYLFAYFASRGELGPTVLAVCVAVLVVTAVSTIGGAASIVVTGLYFAVASLVIQIGLEKVVFSYGWLTGGAAGRSVARPYLTGFFNTQRVIYVIVGGACLVLTAAVWSSFKTRIGFHAVLVGWSPEGAASAGLCTWRWKLLVFAMSGSIIGIAGCLNAFANGTPPPPPFFGVVWSVVFLALAVASGMRHLRSLWMVAAAYTVVPVLLEHHRIPPNLLSGVILLIALILSQSGTKIVARVKRELAGGSRDAETSFVEFAQALPTVARNGHRRQSSFRLDPSARVDLVGTSVSVTFGGVRAVDDVDIHVAPGERFAIVGGNGAGKTTLFNALTGYVPLTRGTVALGGVDVTRRSACVRARAGIRRTFQIPRLADVLTVGQNVRCGYGGELGTSTDRIDWLLHSFGLDAVKDMPITALPFGHRRKTEIVRALARGPRILMMDEPVSGLEDDEVTDILEVLLDIQDVEGWSLVVIEHDLRFITGIAEQLMVMEDGKVMTAGDVASVLADDRVQRVYLGDLV